MGTLLDRAYANLNLTPLERAALRLLEGIVASAFIAGVVAVVPLLAGSTVDWANVGRVFASAAVTALLLAITKYVRAWGDPPLPGPALPISAAGGPVAVHVSIPVASAPNAADPATEAPPAATTLVADQEQQTV